MMHDEEWMCDANRSSVLRAITYIIIISSERIFMLMRAGGNCNIKYILGPADL
jgi:hypothetical protein